MCVPRGLAWRLALLIMISACGHAEANAQARPTRAADGPPPANSVAEGPIVLEFDVPDGFRTEPAGSAMAVTGFRVGYFHANDAMAIRTVDFARDTLIVQDRTVRVTLPSETVPECAGGCVIRVQTLSRRRASAWSNPVPLSIRAGGVGQPQPRAQAPRPPRGIGPQTQPRTPPPRRRAGLTPADIEPYAALSEALRKGLPKEASLDAELRRFRRVEDLALAVVISRNYAIPLTLLGKTLEGPPRVTPRNALTKLRQDLDARSAIRKSRAESRQLTATRQDTRATGR